MFPLNTEGFYSVCSLKYIEIWSTRVRNKGSGPYVLHTKVQRTELTPSVHNTVLYRTRCPSFDISGPTTKPFFRPCWTQMLLCKNNAEPGTELFWYPRRQRPCLLAKRDAMDATSIIFIAKQIKQSSLISKIFDCLVFKSRLQSYDLRLLTPSVKVKTNQ